MHMYEAYGGWTFAFVDYYDMNITECGRADMRSPYAMSRSAGAPICIPRMQYH